MSAVMDVHHMANTLTCSTGSQKRLVEHVQCGSRQAGAAHRGRVARGLHPAHAERVRARPVGRGRGGAGARVPELRAAHSGAQLVPSFSFFCLVPAPGGPSSRLQRYWTVKQAACAHGACAAPGTAAAHGACWHAGRSRTDDLPGCTSISAQEKSVLLMSTGALGSLCHGSARPLPCFKPVSTAQCMCARVDSSYLS